MIGTTEIGNFDTDSDLEIAVGGYSGSTSSTPLFVINHEATDVDGVPFIDGEKIKAVPEEDVDRTSAEGKASSVQFIHFKFNDEQIKKFKSNSSLIEVGIDHNEYSHSTKLNDATVKSLSADFN